MVFIYSRFYFENQGKAFQRFPVEKRPEKCQTHSHQTQGEVISTGVSARLNQTWEILWCGCEVGRGPRHHTHPSTAGKPEFRKCIVQRSACDNVTSHSWLRKHTVPSRFYWHWFFAQVFVDVKDWRLTPVFCHRSFFEPGSEEPTISGRNDTGILARA